MKLSRREAMVGAVLGLMAPRPPPPSAAEVAAELAKLKELMAPLVEWLNTHQHHISSGPTSPPQPHRLA
jgi:hypothetical protein